MSDMMMKMISAGSCRKHDNFSHCILLGWRGRKVSKAHIAMSEERPITGHGPGYKWANAKQDATLLASRLCPGRRHGQRMQQSLWTRFRVCVRTVWLYRMAAWLFLSFMLRDER